MRRAVPLLLGWTLTRLALVLAPHAGYAHGPAVLGDVRRYARWAVTLAAGHFPEHDPEWQYPPGAGWLLALPRLVSAQHYVATFVGLMLLADAALTVLLARRHGTPAAWRWLIGSTALGPIVLHRFDLVPAALAVAALSAAPAAAGVLLAAGALVKLWPALLLGAVRDRGRAALSGLGIGLLVLAVLAVAGTLGESLGFARQQGARGLQIEAVAATPYLLARSFGAGGVRVEHAYGAYQVLGPGVTVLATATTLAGVLVVATYAWLARHRPGDLPLALAALLAVLATARVLSPQYLIWALPLAAVVGGRPARLLIVAAALSQVVYPFWYDGLRGGGVAPTLLLALRNVVLVAALGAALAQRRSRGSNSNSAT